jgi:Uma2 family endonuclease
MLSPDAAYILPEQLEGLTDTQLTGFPYLCPAFLIELLPAADRLAELREKMGLWIANGSLLGCLIDPYKQQVLVYVPGSEPGAVEHIARGSGPVGGLVLDLAKVWSCYEL